MPQYGGVYGEAVLATAIIQRKTGRKGYRGGTHRIYKTIQFYAKLTPSNHFR